MHRTSRLTIVIVILGLRAAPLAAQQPDMNVMAKWSAVTVVHYVMTGEFKNPLVIMRSNMLGEAKPTVSDRVELTFNWNQQQMALVGPVGIQNYNATWSFAPPSGECPLPRITAPYEGFTVTAVTGGSGMLTLKVKRGYAAGAFPRAKPNVTASQEVCGDVWVPVAATAEDDEMMVGVASTMWYAIPSAGGESVSVTKDGKSIVVVDNATGWTWTYTATPVR